MTDFAWAIVAAPAVGQGGPSTSSTLVPSGADYLAAGISSIPLDHAPAGQRNTAVLSTLTGATYNSPAAAAQPNPLLQPVDAVFRFPDLFLPP
jgi:hypothetical protein